MEYFSEIPFVDIELGNLTMNPLNRVIRYYYKHETTTNNIILNSAAFKFKEQSQRFYRLYLNTLPFGTKEFIKH